MENNKENTRLEQLFKIARDSQKYGSIYRHLSEEQATELRNKVRVVSLTAFREMKDLSQEDVFKLMNTPYGIPPK